MDDHLRFPAAARARRAAVRGALAFALTFFVGVPVAYLAAVRPSGDYTARGTLWIEEDSPGEVAGVVPIRTSSSGSEPWVELLRSSSVLDDVAFTAELDSGGRLLRLSLTRDDPREAVDVLNATMRRYAELAAELKRSRLATFESVLSDQLASAETRLVEAERDLETFRIETISLAPARPRTALPRDAEEARLVRAVVDAEELYNQIRGRVQQARLAVDQARPDISILDGAQLSTRGRAVRLPLAALILLVVVAGSLPLAALVERIAGLGTQES